MRLDAYGFDVARHKLGGPGYPIRLVEPDDARDAHTFRPGDTVSHWTDADSFGTVVSVARCEVTVLWSTCPRDPSPSRARHLGRLFSLPTSLARSLIVVQPMPDPPATCFYFDPDRDAGPVTT